MPRLIPLIVALILSAIAHAADRPNVVLVVVDDLGWTDPAFMGSDFHRTPSFDRLATQGMVFTQAYAAAANCAPSRAAYMSGQYAPRTGVYTVGSPARGKSVNRRLIPAPNRRDLDEGVVTLAESLQHAGYRTAHMGKWHLGKGDEGGPLEQGFDVNVGGNQAGHPKSYTPPYKNPDLSDGPAGEHLTTRLTDEAIRFITTPSDDPFFLHLAYYAVHTPIQPPANRLAETEARTPGERHTNAKYAALVEQTDWNLGRLLDAIDAADLGDETIVIVTSDNGGHGGVTNALPLRGAKGMYYEGGIRVPFVVRWPGVIEAGTRCHEPIIGVDLYPTLCEITGTPMPAQIADGVSIASLLAGATLGERSLFWHFPAYLEGGRSWRTTPCSVIRRGDLKLIEYFETGATELYDLAADPYEQHDVAATRTGERDVLHTQLRVWREATGAIVPTELNPGYREAVTLDAEPVLQPAALPQRRPNIIYIMADDLGYAELGCYGQEWIRTPNIDRIATEGVLFTQHYAGSPVCAPSRCNLMTGKHPGHAYIRDNGDPVERRGLGTAADGFFPGQNPIPDAEVTIAEALKAVGYATAAAGKWGLGYEGSSGDPNRQGFDLFYGFICQRHAHNHYPRFLWRNGVKEVLPGNDRTLNGETYSQDMFVDVALEFIRENKDQPFFLYLPFAVPHLSIQVPEATLASYLDVIPEEAYEHRGYLEHPFPRAGYAAMITHMDAGIGAIMDLVAELGLDDDTLIVFTSDNGPTYNRLGGSDSDFFASAGPFRGLKGSSYEGGLRVPLVARWPGRIESGRTSDHLSASWDVMSTLCEVAAAPTPAGVDGISFLPALTGHGEQPRHEYLYWEFGGYGGHQAVRLGDWKALRLQIKKGNRDIELYDLSTDIGETTDVSDRHPDVVAEIERIMDEEHVPSTLFPMPFDDVVH